MKITKKLTLIALLMFIGCFIILQTSKVDSYAASTQPSTAVKNDIPDYNKKVKNHYTGWIKSKSKTVKLFDGGFPVYYYMKEGRLENGWSRINNNKYFFKSDYTMAYGVESINDTIYIFGIMGKSDYGKLKYNSIYIIPRQYNNAYSTISTTWIVDSDGEAVKTGWGAITFGTKGYAYAEKYHPFVNGWKKIDGYWYYFKDYRRCTGWITDNGNKYYLNGLGMMLTGVQEISGKYYYFNSSGKMMTGWQKINNKWYYFNSNGTRAEGLTKINNKLYYFDYYMLTGWERINGYWYYFKTDGSAITGTTTKIGNKTYSFRSNGTCINK